MNAEDDDLGLVSADEVIDEIAETLREADGEFIEAIANQVLSRKVEYVEDSMFRLEEDDD